MFTDHKLLTFALKQKPNKASPRQLRHMSFISQFTFDIQHVFGNGNAVANAFSHVAEVKIRTTIDFPAIVKTQTHDAVLQCLRTNSKYSFREFLIFGTNAIYFDRFPYANLVQAGIRTANRLLDRTTSSRP